MDLFELLWDTSQQIQLNSNSEQILSNSTSIESAHRSIRDLRIQAIKLTVTCQVLCDLLSKSMGIDENEISRLIKERLNLDSTVLSRLCPACGHHFHENRTNCMYCGYSPGVHEP